MNEQIKKEFMEKFVYTDNNGTVGMYPHKVSNLWTWIDSQLDRVREEGDVKLFDYLKSIYGEDGERFNHPAGRDFVFGVRSVFETIDSYLKSKSGGKE
jgi:hypothetical protein